jgi:hypothetical protein
MIRVLLILSLGMTSCMERPRNYSKAEIINGLGTLDDLPADHSRSMAVRRSGRVGNGEALK